VSNADEFHNRMMNDKFWHFPVHDKRMLHELHFCN